MGKRGPRREPTVMKLAKGTYRADRQGNPVDELQTIVLSKVPPAPGSLGEKGREVWQRVGPLLCDSGVLHCGDLEAFAMYCHAHDEYEKCNKTLAADGEYHTGPTGKISPHPALHQRLRWVEVMRRFQSEFGLTPSARNNVRVEKKAEAKVKPRRRA